MIYILLIILFTLVQALLLGRIHIFGVVTPLMYVYLALLMPRNIAPWKSMLICFFMGLAVDMFENTPGLAAASMTLTAFVQPRVLELFLKKEDEPDLIPGINTLGYTKYIAYAIILTMLYCLTFFTLEAFASVRWADWLLSVGGSLLITLVTIIIIDSVRR